MIKNKCVNFFMINKGKVGSMFGKYSLYAEMRLKQQKATQRFYSLRRFLN